MVDFIAVSHWPVFNVADMAVVCGGGAGGCCCRCATSTTGTASRKSVADPCTPDDRRLLPIPDGLVGERADAAVARLTGLSRSRAAAIIDDGGVRVDGVAVGRSFRLPPDAMIEVEMPQPESAPSSDPIAVPGHARSSTTTPTSSSSTSRSASRPIRARAGPGPTVIGGLAAAGFRIATSGAAERQGVVHRLDVGTSGVMVVAKSEAAYSDLKRQFRERTVDKIYHALVQGHPDPSAGHDRGPDRPAPDRGLQVGGHRGRQAQRHALRDAGGVSGYASLLRVRLETGRTHQIRVHMSAVRHPCVGDLTYGADPVLAERLGLTRQWLHAVGADHRPSGNRSADDVHAATIRTTWPRRWTGCPMPTGLRLRHGGARARVLRECPRIGLGLGHASGGSSRTSPSVEAGP